MGKAQGSFPNESQKPIRIPHESQVRGEATSDELLVNGYGDQGLPGRGSLCDQSYHVISRLHPPISMKMGLPIVNK